MRALILVSVCGSIIECVLPSLSFGQETPPEQNGRVQAVSLLQRVATNWRRLEQYDLAVVEERYRMQDERKIERFVSRTRLIADHTHHRYLFVGIGSRENVPTRGYAAFCLDAAIGQAWKRFSADDPAMQVWKKGGHESDVNEGLARSGFPDVRFVGTAAYQRQFLNLSIDEFFTTEFTFGQDIKAIPLGDDSVEVVENILTGKVSRFQRRYTFDGRKPVPTRLVFINSLRDGTKRFVRNDESITWKEIGGVSVPIEIRGLSRPFRSAEPEHYVAAFEWFAVNDADRLPSFGVGLLSDDEAIWRFVPERLTTDEPTDEPEDSN